MDPITIITTALVTGAASASKDVATQVIKDAYNSLKELISRKFDNKIDLNNAIEDVEKQPESEGRQIILQKKIDFAGIAEAQEVLNQSLILLKLLHEYGEDIRTAYESTLRRSKAWENVKVVGQQAMLLEGDVFGDIFGPGAKREDHYHSDSNDNHETLREAYLRRLIISTSHLSLAGIDPKATNAFKYQLNLSALYTALYTLTPEAQQKIGKKHKRETRLLSALEKLNFHSHLILLGDPGSGKSTFINFVALCMAGEILGHDEINLNFLTMPVLQDEDENELHRQRWDHGALLPIRVILRDFAAFGLPSPQEEATAQHLWDFIVHELETVALGGFKHYLSQELLKERGLLLLDGFDEVPAVNNRRTQVKKAVEDFALTFNKCRILMTSRTYAYQNKNWRLDGFEETSLAPFNQKQIHLFIRRWYEHISTHRNMHIDEAHGQAELLNRAILSNKRLRVLAERPLLLTLMASLHSWRGGCLPEKREQLYNDAVDSLLDWWERPKIVRGANGEIVVQQPSLAEWLKIDRNKVRSLLNRLAYQAHAAQTEMIGTADIPEGDLISGLIQLSNNPDVNLKRLVEYLSFRAGLLLPRGTGLYTFPHRTFQEYLAACYLTDQEYPERVADLALKEPNRWREVALLAGAKAARGTSSAIWSLVEELCFQDLSEIKRPTPKQIWGAHLAGQALMESANLDEISKRNWGKVKRIREWLVFILETGVLPAADRVATGVALSHLGDPRLGISLGEDGLPDISWCQIPSGSFLMGSANDDDNAFRREKPQHEQNPNAYQISRYPVTNAQYSAFIQSDGYDQRDFWTEEGWAWRTEKEVVEPKEFGRPFSLSNHPVVGINWYEALAFCRWLTNKLRASGQLDRTQEVSLPTEPQWEKAARGDFNRCYPWGDTPDPDRANYNETNIGMTSAVGCFPHGASPYGVMDLSGNVWEWTRSLWGEDNSKPRFMYPYSNKDGRENLEADRDILRVLRGGSFSYPSRLIRVTYRDWNFPANRDHDIGFRLVINSIND